MMVGQAGGIDKGYLMCSLGHRVGGWDIGKVSYGEGR